MCPEPGGTPAVAPLESNQAAGEERGNEPESDLEVFLGHLLRLEAPRQTRGAYRLYGEAELARLRAIRRAQQLGFSLEEIDGLLALDEDTDRQHARLAAQAKIELIDGRLRQLQQMRSALAELVDYCEHTDAPAPCPILRALSSD